MAGIKIVDLPALGRDLISTDLLELSLAGGTGSRKITGQEIMNASKLSVGNTPIINGAVGQVLFQGTGNVLQESANLFWDNTNGRFGIGTSSPAFPLDILGSSSIIGMKLRNSLSSGYTEINLFNNSGGSNDRMYMGVGGTTTGDAFQNRGYFFSGSNLEGINFTANKATTGDIRFFTGGVNERLRINGTGNLLINTTTDAGFKLDVNGTARVSGAFQVNQSNQVIGDVSFQSGAGGGILRLLATSAGKASGSFYYDGSDVSNSAYGAFGIATSGTYFGVTGSVLFASSKNGTGTQLPMSFGGFNGSWTNWMQIKTNGNVLINTTTDDGFKLDVNGTARVQGALTLANGLVRIDNTASGSNALFSFLSTAPFFYSNTYSMNFGATSNSGGAAFTNGVLQVWNQLNLNNLLILSDGNTTAGERLRVTKGGNVLIGTTTDAGFKLDVNGTARISGDLSVPTGKITFQSSSFGIDCNTSTGVFDIKNSAGTLQTTRISFREGTYLNIYQPTQSITGISSGIINTISTPITYAWSSGTVQSNLFVLNPTINNTGTYNGTFRGFYYNPTLTSMTGTTHFAFHSTSGRVRFEGLPTSPTGLNAGDIYNDGGTLKIV